jgi:hypothetical protein
MMKKTIYVRIRLEFDRGVIENNGTELFAVGRPKTAKQAQFSCPECGPRHHIPVPVSVPIRLRDA